jgi:hypothetical protein
MAELKGKTACYAIAVTPTKFDGQVVSASSQSYDHLHAAASTEHQG